MFVPPHDWVENPPDDLESVVQLLHIFYEKINEPTPEGNTLRKLFKQGKKFYDSTLQQVKDNDPQAFFKPSYEQALLLNCWVWGINFPICFAANRIGKTSGFVFNGILWLYPNNPSFRCFKSYTDLYGRTVQVLPRPRIDQLLSIQAAIRVNPNLMGDPYKQPYEGQNKEKVATLQQIIPDAYKSVYPYPPVQTGGQIWLGAPDNDFHKHIIMPRWRSLLPKPLLKDSDADRTFIISTASTTNPKTTAHEIICKSYESEDTKWSGDAVHGIVLTEGFTKEILNEIKNRVTNEAFMSWDYTPAEARNVGKKVHLAYQVYKKKEELPLSPFCFTKFSVRTAPDFIIPKEKKADMIRMWSDTKEGVSRLDGDFYSSSGLILDALNREFHCLSLTLRELIMLIPNGRFYRGIDPGFDHPTTCVWGYLAPNNVWYIYRSYSKRGTTIAERCRDIISLSGNMQERTPRGFLVEVHPIDNLEIFTANPTDYHTFKTDETTGQSYANQYFNEGLLITESTHMGPEERAVKANTMLSPNAHPYLAHPIKNIPPGSKVYFLHKEFGVSALLDKFDQLFWDRYKAGDNKGEPKDKVPTHGDDELDGFCNLVCSPYVWTQREPNRRPPNDNNQIDQRTLTRQKMDWNDGLTKEKVATLQLSQMNPGYFGG